MVSRSKEFSFSTAQQLIAVREFVGGGGLNCEVKAQVLAVTPPPPLFFMEVGHKKGGGGSNSGAVRYMTMAVNQLNPQTCMGSGRLARELIISHRACIRP